MFPDQSRTTEPESSLSVAHGVASVTPVFSFLSGAARQPEIREVLEATMRALTTTCTIPEETAKLQLEALNKSKEEESKEHTAALNDAAERVKKTDESLLETETEVPKFRAALYEARAAALTEARDTALLTKDEPLDTNTALSVVQVDTEEKAKSA